MNSTNKRKNEIKGQVNSEHAQTPNNVTSAAATKDAPHRKQRDEGLITSSTDVAIVATSAGVEISVQLVRLQTNMTEGAVRNLYPAVYYCILYYMVGGVA